MMVLVVVRYAYNAWGKLLSITGSMADTLGVQNPLRYRGYVYDHETGLYYLQSRYYDPEIDRFINADALIFLFAITGGKYDFHTSSKKINVYTTHKWVDIVFLAVQLVSYELG